MLPHDVRDEDEIQVKPRVCEFESLLAEIGRQRNFPQQKAFGEILLFFAADFFDGRYLTGTGARSR